MFRAFVREEIRGCAEVRKVPGDFLRSRRGKGLGERREGNTGPIDEGIRGCFREEGNVTPWGEGRKAEGQALRPSRELGYQ